jgi:hypothetical protein
MYVQRRMARVVDQRAQRPLAASSNLSFCIFFCIFFSLFSSSFVTLALFFPFSSRPHLLRVCVVSLHASGCTKSGEMNSEEGWSRVFQSDKSSRDTVIGTLLRRILCDPHPPNSRRPIWNPAGKTSSHPKRGSGEYPQEGDQKKDAQAATLPGMRACSASRLGAALAGLEGGAVWRPSSRSWGRGGGRLA